MNSKRSNACLLGAAMAWLTIGCADAAGADTHLLFAPLRHLRSGATRQWSDFPEQSAGDRLAVTFHSEANTTPQTLMLRQQDVKQRWSLVLNGRPLATLAPNDNDLVATVTVPAGALVSGENTLIVEGAGRESDDIWLGEIRLDPRPPAVALAEATVKVEIISAESGQPMPGRITIVGESGALAALGSQSDAAHAVRPGVVYTADGSAEIRLPRGRYTLYAGRGFEYGVARTAVELRPGDTVSRRMTIAREVATPGYVACDTHCHTFTYSRHGDATLAERLITLAGEGIELPVATDHNLQVEYTAALSQAGLSKYFTSVVGNEVTTPVGHFNVFPLAAGGSIDYRGRTWSEVFAAIHQAPQAQVIVLNHADDVHGGFRPFGAERHISLTGEDLDGWRLEANAMEVINSGALRNDPLELVRGWFGMLNAGVSLAPVGSSDSHDVSRYIVGQGRTYVRAADADPGQIDIAEACRSFRQGRVLASLGLLAEIAIDKYGPGDLVTAGKSVRVRVRVSGPSWTQATHLALYANGLLVREVDIASGAGARPGLKWQDEWAVELAKQDVYLVAIARGPGVCEPFWPIAKPYQPSSPDWEPYVLGISGAVRIDADGQPGFTGAKEYAEACWRQADGGLPRMMRLLAAYDESVAAQAAGVLRSAGHGPYEPAVLGALRSASPAVRRGFGAYQSAWRTSQAAHAQPGAPRP
jgi:hypothetical protein